ncbi:MAG TPA: xanthine dehydrogenase family protein molybdopterin-binding subunit [Chloroflexota bacterium]|jgi:CO/xanthine dehydrogenase Mo-binding subunit|nr:xanthine dehydrogenase family protein molybdopterin-binding subunit [Chloroflexota bacterium]
MVLREREPGTSAPVVVGQALPYLDAVERVTGAVPYTLNLELPGMLHVKLLRSPHPHARIRRIDPSGADRVPGVAYVLTGPRLLELGIGTHYGVVIQDKPIVAIDKVRYVGDIVAAVAAVDEDTALEALEHIAVEYEELPAVFDAEEALRPGAPLLFETLPPQRQTFADIIVHRAEGTNLCNHFKLRKGDVAQGFAEADELFEDVYSTPAAQHCPLEPHVVLAQWEPDGRLVVWSATQTPYSVRADLAELFRLPQAKVRVLTATLGGAYGAKSYIHLEPLAATLALAARRPVKLVLSRQEEFLEITKHPSRIYIRTGVKRDGTLTAREIRCYWSAGAYADISPRLIKNGGYASPGPYRIPHIKVDSYGVYTNLPPAGAFRGYGAPQAHWAGECQIDDIARALGIDPVELRLRNLLRDGDAFATSEQMHDVHFHELLREAAAKVGWGTPKPAPRPGKAIGRGVAVALKSTVTPSTSVAAVRVEADGSITVLSSTVEMGQGAKGILAQIAAEKFGVGYDRVRVVDPDTDITPYDQSTTSSRSTFSMGTAVQYAAEDACNQLRELAAGLLEAAPGDIEIAGGRVFVKGSPDQGLPIGHVLARTRRQQVLGHGTFVTEGGLDPETGQGVAAVHWHHAAGAAEVEVDLETGQVEVLRYHTEVYVGRAVNPRNARLQNEGSVILGLGQTFFEEMRYDDGQLVNGNLADYMIPSFEDLPGSLSSRFVEHPSGRGEAHGLGETAVPPVAAAIGNAIRDATGVRIRDLPLTPERVLRALEAQRAARPPAASSDHQAQGER